VTIAIRPSYGCGMARDVEVIWVKSEPEYFRPKGWTGDSPICPAASQIRKNRSSSLPIAGARVKKWPQLLGGAGAAGGCRAREEPAHKNPNMVSRISNLYAGLSRSSLRTPLSQFEIPSVRDGIGGGNRRKVSRGGVMRPRYGTVSTKARQPRRASSPQLAASLIS
jgi:hypothetical protein